MEIGVTVCYLLVMVLGLAWVVYRVLLYIRVEREREQDFSAIMSSGDQFKAYLQDLKQQNSGQDESDDQSAETGSTEETAPSEQEKQ